MNRILYSLWDMLLSEMIDKARAVSVSSFSQSLYYTEMISSSSSSSSDDDDTDSTDSSTNEPVEHHPILYEYTAHAQDHPQATGSPNDEPTCPAVQSTQVTEQEDTGELT